MNNNKFLLSRFAHKYAKGDIVAYMNSLRMRPVYLGKSLATNIENWIARKEPLINDAQTAINELLKNKILINDVGYDDLILTRYRQMASNTSIKIAYFIMTDQCNFNCSYCFIKKEIEKGHKVSGAMTPEIALAATRVFANLSVKDPSDDERMIIFYGGEPLLNYNVIKIVAEEVDKLKKARKLSEKTKMVVVTNGSLLTDEIASFFKKSGIGIGISVDGIDVVTNSSRKYSDGETTFEDIMRGIEICKKNQIYDYSLSVTISKSCLEHYESTMNFLKENTKSVGFNILMLDNENINDDSYAQEAALFLIKAFDFFRNEGIYEDRMMRKVNAFVEGKVHIFDCAATGANQIVVAPDGEIGICHGFLGSRTFFSGNVNDSNYDPTQHEHFINWSKRTPLNMPECLNCDAIGLCGGGCPFNAYQKRGNIWDIDDRFCVHTKTTLEWLIWDLYKQSCENTIIN